MALPRGAVLLVMRLRASVDTLVPNGTDNPPPRIPAVFPPSELFITESVEACPTRSTPPPSASAVFVVIELLEIVSAQRAQRIPPPFAAALPDTVLPLRVRCASVAVADGASYEPITAMPPPSSCEPLSRAVLLLMTVQLLRTTVAPRTLIPPPVERNPLAEPPLIVRLLIVT